MMRLQQEAGFSSVEAVMIMTLIGMATLSMGHTLLSGHQALSHVEADSLILDQAQLLMSRLHQIPFGAGTESAASASALGMLVAIENDYFGSATGNGSGSGGQGPMTQAFTGANVTLTQVRLASPMIWAYASAGQTYYGGSGNWKIVVDRDLNGDGDTTDALELATATSQDLFRVEISFNDRRVLHTVRTRLPSE